MRAPLQLLILAVALLVMTAKGAPAANYSFQLINNTGLDPAQYSIYGSVGKPAELAQ